jgi:hypothetical protein
MKCPETMVNTIKMSKHSVAFPSEKFYLQRNIQYIKQEQHQQQK